MIGSLRGNLLRLDLDSLLIEVSGVGYEVMIPFPLHLQLRETVGKETFIYVYHSITDRNQKLFGFSTNKDRELFKLIKSLHGIGELTALKILSFFQADELYQIAQADDRKTLEKIPKVKGKTSEKILFEIKQNLKKLESFLREDKKEYSITNAQTDLAILALIQLGYDEKTANREVDLIRKVTPDLEAGEIVRKVITK
ncbi:Holliday junction branch migration protein RuvA [Leptospira ognonensis]|uniref:Holliday junction branch migration complex subunit RuvA n=1 Tax=Leptospira ognonensis TaxID=2484945 RepID=A0A4V3JSB5_9LEPT|nr:Holliday junction branch migration protein RuvA [Leptospira ognonensis]TGL63960.1 Holliday junction branch migration protein RuvA [Leptospira ognonensis]